jgi:hypothetical protein
MHFSTFEAILASRACVMALISVRVALGATAVGSQQGSEFSPYREKVAEELLLCEVMVQSEMKRYNENQSVYEAAQQDATYSSGTAAADRLPRHSSADDLG